MRHEHLSDDFLPLPLLDAPLSVSRTSSRQSHKDGLPVVYISSASPWKLSMSCSLRELAPTALKQAELKGDNLGHPNHCRVDSGQHYEGAHAHLPSHVYASTYTCYQRLSASIGYSIKSCQPHESCFAVGAGSVFCPAICQGTTLLSSSTFPSTSSFNFTFGFLLPHSASPLASGCCCRCLDPKINFTSTTFNARHRRGWPCSSSPCCCSLLVVRSQCRVHCRAGLQSGHARTTSFRRLCRFGCFRRCD